MTRVERTTGYAPEFDLKVIDGDKAESEFTRLLCAAGDTFEVKSDIKSRTTHNVAIEFKQHGQRSGLATTKAAWHAIETFEQVYIVLPTWKLKEVAGHAWRLRGETAMGDNGNVGVLVPVAWLLPVESGALSLQDELALEQIGNKVFRRAAA